MTKKIQTIDQASCYVYFDEERKWFKFIFYKDYFPSEDCLPFLVIFIPSKENKMTLEITSSLKSRIKHAGYDIGHFTNCFGNKESIEQLIQRTTRKGAKNVEY